MTSRYDWSRVEWAGPWTQEEAEAFARRVEQVADEEAARTAPPPVAS